MYLSLRCALLGAFLFAACALGRYPAVSSAQMQAPFQSSWTGANLVAVMPDRASVSGWVMPADPAWFADGFSGNLVVIEQRWQMARGASVDATCSVTAPLGEIADLMPLDQPEGERESLGFFDAPGRSTVRLATTLPFDGKPQSNLRALLLGHSNPLSDPIVVHVQLVAF